MSTQFTNRQWRLPNNENKDKQSNYSIQASSTNARINISSPANVGITSSFAFWLKRTNNTAITQPYRISTGGVLYGMYMNGTTAIYVRYGGSPITINNTATLNALALTDWVHWVITREEVTSTTQDVKLYANGSLIYSLNGTSTLGTYDSEIDYLMWSLQTTDFMDSFSIFDYALTDGTGGTVNQIAALYGSSSTGIGNPMSLSPKPVAYYPLGDQDAFNGADYLVPNSSLKDYVFDFVPNDNISFGNAIGNLIGDNYTGGFTISFWMNPDVTSGEDGIFNFSTNEMSLVLRSNSIRLYNNGQKASITYTNPNNEWSNCVLSFLPSGSVFYLNGVPVANWTYTDLDLNGLDFSIGWYATTNYAYDGKLTNFQIWNTNLSSTEAETLYNNGSLYTGTQPQNSNLIAWWKLNASDTYDSSTGNWTIEDHAGSNDGTSSGMTQANLVQSDLSFTSGYSPYALDFDGADDYIDLGTPSTFAFGTGDFTIGGWVYLDSSTNYQWLFSTGTNFAFGFDSSRNLQLWVGGTATASSFNINLNQWHHILATRNSGTVTFYIDGSAFGTTYSRTGSIAAGSYNYIGTFNVNQNHLDGKISNVSIWNAALTSSQVTEIYNEGVPSNLNNHSAYSSLVSWWQLGSNTSWVDPYWIALDEKGTNNGQSQNVAAPNNMGESAIVDGVGSYANGLSSGMGGDEVIGDAPYSTANSLSVNMDVEDRTTDTPS